MTQNDPRYQQPMGAQPGADPNLNQQPMQGGQAGHPMQQEQPYQPGQEHQAGHGQQGGAYQEPGMGNGGGQPGMGNGGGEGGAMPWHELEGYRSRFVQVQSEFIENPRGAVEHAGGLLKEAIDRMMATTRDGDGGGADTERLRVAMQRYRGMLDQLGEGGAGGTGTR